MILVDGYLYGAADRFSQAKWVCLDWKTGEVLESAASTPADETEMAMTFVEED